MSKVVCTAFYPFNGRQENVSYLVVSKLPEKITNMEIDKVYLDVSWEKTPKQVVEILKCRDVDFLILTGEASKRKYVCIESVALNLMDAQICDNDGLMMRNQKIDSTNLINAGYFSNYDCYKLQTEVNKRNYNVKVSTNCGSYICNLSYYTALKYIYENNLKTKVIFVHFPDNFKVKYPNILKEIIKKIGE